MRKNVENYLNEVGLVQSIRDVENLSLGLEEVFKHVDSCGDMILKVNRNNISYVDNNSPQMKANRVLIEKTRDNLKAYISNVVKYFNEYYKSTKDEKNKKLVIESVKNIIRYSLDFGFYGKALELSKILYEKTGIENYVVVNKAIEGYAHRQLLSGKNYSKRINVIIREARIGEFGPVNKKQKTSEFKDIFNNYKIKIGKKVFDMKKYQELTSISPVK